MKWFFPSWSGDFRLVPAKRAGICLLKVLDPTPAEVNALTHFLTLAKERGWRPSTDPAADAIGPKNALGRWRKLKLVVPIAEAGQALLGLLLPADRTLTAVRYDNGRIRVAETAEVPSLLGASAAADQHLESPYRKPAKPTKEKKKPEPKAVVSAKRPTASCPSCIAGAIGPASEVLLSFLDEAEHAEWAQTRTLTVTGGMTGHRYLLAHRHSELARDWTRIAFDLEDEAVLHFHDWSVPPEEEVLGAKLILEHREHWLRNEASCVNAFGRTAFTNVLKNPFGTILDGVWDSTFVGRLGKDWGFSPPALPPLDLTPRSG